MTSRLEAVTSGLAITPETGGSEDSNGAAAKAAPGDHGDAPAPASNGADALSEYRQRKLELAELIQALMTIAHERHDDEREHSGRELLARLAEDNFQLAVVGQFSRGKSTLMNAILGGEYLPTGALPMTSVVTTVRYASQPGASVRRAGSAHTIDIPLDELVRFVAQQSGEREELQIVAAEVEVPAEILRLGFSFVDTPGIGSAIATNTATTEDFLPQADAVIFVTSCDAPLSESELEFLAKVRHHVQKLFLVVNKIDLVPAPEAQTILRYVREQLGAGSDGVELRVFATSARQALTARMTADPAGLAESGLPAMEQPLVRFLTDEKSRVFLQQTCNRAQRLLARQQADLELARFAQAQDASARKSASETFSQGVSELIAGAHTRAAAVRQQLQTQLPAVLLERSRTWPEELGDAVAGLVQAAHGHTSRSQLEASLTTIEQAAQPLLDEWLRQRITDLHTLLFQTAGDDIEAMLTAPHAVERLAGETYGRSADSAASQTHSWSPGDLPPLEAPRVAFAAQLQLPPWFLLVRSEDDTRRRLREALQSAVSAYSQQARSGLAAAADRWMQRLDERVAQDIQRAADRVRGRLETPCRDDHTALLQQIGASLASFHREIVAWRPTPAILEQSAPAALQPSPPLVTDPGPPCTVCQRLGMVSFDYLAHAQYELSSRQERRAEHAASGGFCPLHTWLYSQTAEPVGIALTYAELTRTAAADLRGALRSTSSRQQLREVLAHLSPGHDRCPVCRALVTAEREAVADVLERLPQDPDGEAPPGLCVPHLARVLDANPKAEQAKWLAASLAVAMERAAEDMRAFALKRQSLRRGLISDEERVAYRQAICRIAGHRELARPWRTDDDDRLP